MVTRLARYSLIWYEDSNVFSEQQSHEDLNQTCRTFEPNLSVTYKLGRRRASWPIVNGVASPLAASADYTKPCYPRCAYANMTRERSNQVSHSDRQHDALGLLSL